MGIGGRVLARQAHALPSLGGPSLDRARSKVTDRMIDIIAMRDREGMVWRDIAVQVGIHTSFAKMLYARARVILEEERQRDKR